MSDLFNLGAEPVDQLAARLLFKSPWWAKAPEEIRFAEKNLAAQIQFFPSLFKAPPPEVKNRIGELCHSAMVIGYAHKGRQEYRNVPARRKLVGLKPSKHERFQRPRESNGHMQVWYVLFNNGIVLTVRGDTINRWQKMSRNRWESWFFANEGYQDWQQSLCLKL